MPVKEYHVENLHCPTCSAKIAAEIGAIAGVQSVNLDYLNQRLIIESKTESALERLNQIADMIEPGVKIHVKKIDSEARLYIALEQKWILIGIGLSFYIISALISVSHLVNMILILIAYLLVSQRVLWSALRKMTSLRFLDEHFLMMIASIGALILGEYSEAIAVMLLYEIGQTLEAYSVKRSRKAISRSVSHKVDTTHLVTEGGVSDVATTDISIGQMIQVFPGERIPLDGEVVRGESSVDTSSLTGESEPLSVSTSSLVCAGFLNGSGLLQIMVSHIEAESTIARILKLIDSATQLKSKTELFITQFARYYTPVVVALAVLIFLIPVLLGGAATVWFPRSLIFLIVSCPCALVISIPLTFYIGIGLAAKRGVIFKGSAYLDALRKVKTMVFDKTGTLTTGKLQIEAINAIHEDVKEALINGAYICEHASSHPIAIAIKSQLHSAFDAQQLESYQEFPGKGVAVQYAGERLLAGSAGFFQSYAIDIPISFMEMGQLHIARGDTYLGNIALDDEVRSGLADVFTRLRQMGVQHMSMLSGDKYAKAQKVADYLCLDSYMSDLLPEQKLAELQNIMKTGIRPVAYIGDGLNDAPVLAGADIGIAMGEIGNQASIESADIVLLNDKPEQLAQAYRISQATFRIVVQNICLALGIKVLVMILGVAGWGNLWEAVIADVGVTILAVFNAMRLSRQ